jgi:hypothetical protein
MKRILFVLTFILFLSIEHKAYALIAIPRDDFGNIITFSELSEFDTPGQHRPLHYQTILGVRFDYPLVGLSSSGAFFTTTPSLELGGLLDGTVIEGDGAKVVSARILGVPDRVITKVGFDFAVASEGSLSQALEVEAFDVKDISLGKIYAGASFFRNNTALGGLYILDNQGIHRIAVNFMSRKFLFDNFTFDPLITAETNGDEEGNPIPEPATVLLFASGVVGLTALRRRKK